MTVTAKTMQQAALDLVAQGFTILPLIPEGKIPKTEHGIKDATNAQQGVREYWPNGSRNNIGILCDGLLVCDFDRGDEGLKSLARIEAKYGKLPRTWTVRTGGGTKAEPHERGLQYIYRVDKALNIRPGAGIYSLDGERLEKFDIRANASYIVAVPSVTNEAYETIDEVPVADAPQWLIEIAQKPKKQTITQALGVSNGELIPTGSQDGWLPSQAGVYRTRGDSEETIYQKLLIDIGRCPTTPGKEPYTEADCKRIAKSYGRYPQGTPTEGRHHKNDVGNAERLMSLYGDKIRYCYDRKLWYTWTGKYWKLDDGSGIMRYAQKTARLIYVEAANEPDKDKAEEMGKWASASESNAKLQAMIAQAQPMASIGMDEFDRDIWLLNCANGTINLKTGVLQPHNPSDYITRVISTKYNPDATSAEWVKFLKRTFGDKAELIAFCKRALGYSISGSQGEMAIFFCFGEGWNGKSTLLGAIRLILEEYATEVEPATFMIDKSGGTGPNEAIASLYNVNFVTSTEVEEGQRLSTSLLKRMTGGESLRCEHKFERGWNYKPRYKLWMCGNHQPQLSDTTKSIKNRFHQIPFLFTISPDDKSRIPHYDEVLFRDHGEAILAWLVQGCLEYQKEGLGTSAAVSEATQSYFENQDILHDFLKELCLINPTSTITIADLYKEYLDWCVSNGDKNPLGKVRFNNKIAEKGIVKSQGAGNKTIWLGLRLLTDDEKLNLVKNESEKLKTEEPIVKRLISDNSFSVSSPRVEKVAKLLGIGVQEINYEAKNQLKVAKILKSDDEECPICKGINLAFWPDGTNRKYCTDCFPEWDNEPNY